MRSGTWASWPRYPGILLLAVGVSGVVHAEGSWLASGGRLAQGTVVFAAGGPRQLVVGAQHAAREARAAWSGELAYAHADRFFELRGGRSWSLLAASVFSVTAFVGASALLVPFGPPDVALGPHGGVTVGLGADWLHVQLGLLSGAELFASRLLRFPQRLELALWGRWRALMLGLQARVGADLAVGHAFVLRLDALAVIGWRLNDVAPGPTAREVGASAPDTRLLTPRADW